MERLIPRFDGTLVIPYYIQETGGPRFTQAEELSIHGYRSSLSGRRRRVVAKSGRLSDETSHSPPASRRWGLRRLFSMKGPKISGSTSKASSPSSTSGSGGKRSRTAGDYVSTY